MFVQIHPGGRQAKCECLKAYKTWKIFIAEMKDKVWLVQLHLLVSSEETLLPMLARGDGKAKFFGVGIRGWHGACPTGRAGGIAGLKTVVVPVIGLEALSLDMN